jgi:hypothetical protein
MGEIQFDACAQSKIKKGTVAIEPVPESAPNFHLLANDIIETF